MSNVKANSKYKTIGEVAKILNLINKRNGSLSTHTIRFWEKEFKQIKPMIFYGKRRYYDGFIEGGGEELYRYKKNECQCFISIAQK